MISVVRILVFLFGGLLFAQSNQKELSSDIDKLLIQRIIDSVVPAAMEEYSVPGGAISVVLQDSIIYKEGFGYRNWDQKNAVDPNKTVFRVASVSKLLTTVAVLQLVDDGLVDLDTDVENYLEEIGISNSFDTKVTLRQLLTHTAGFDKRNVLRRRLKEENVPSLKDHLNRRLPDVVHRPGEVITYSNYGFALAGYIVENVSGIPFDEYMDTQIFQPLQMKHSSFTDPSQFKENLAIGYYKDDYIEVPFQFVNTVPASMLMTTAEDASNLLIMLLNDGVFNGQTIIESSSLQKMLTTQVRNHPVLEGRGFGFSIYDTAPIIAHINGHFKGFYSAYYLYPELNLGLFFAFNGNYGYGPTRAVIRAINKEVVGLEYLSMLPEKEDLTSNKIDLTKYEGRYLNTRSAFNNLEKIDNFPADGIKLTVSVDNGLVLDGRNTYYHYKDDIFQNTEGDLLAFKNDENGVPKYLLRDERAYLKMKTLDNEFLHLSTFFLLLLSSIFMIIRYFIKRKQGLIPERRKFLKVSYILSSIIVVFFLLIFILLDVIDITTHYSIPLSLKLTLVLPHISVLLALVLPYFLYKYLQKEGKISLKNIFAVLFVLLMLIHVWYFDYWKFLFYNV